MTTDILSQIAEHYQQFDETDVEDPRSVCCRSLVVQLSDNYNVCTRCGRSFGSER